MDVADSGLALWLGWMERSSHHVPGDLLEFLKARRDLQRHDLAHGDPWTPLVFQPHAVALLLGLLG